MEVKDRCVHSRKKEKCCWSSQHSQPWCQGGGSAEGCGRKTATHKTKYLCCQEPHKPSVSAVLGLVETIAFFENLREFEHFSSEYT
jgi:hypothetical protein